MFNFENYVQQQHIDSNFIENNYIYTSKMLLDDIKNILRLKMSGVDVSKIIHLLFSTKAISTFYMYFNIMDEYLNINNINLYNNMINESANEYINKMTIGELNNNMKKLYSYIFYTNGFDVHDISKKVNDNIVLNINSIENKSLIRFLYYLLNFSKNVQFITNNLASIDENYIINNII